MKLKAEYDFDHKTGEIMHLSLYEFNESDKDKYLGSIKGSEEFLAELKFAINSSDLQELKNKNFAAQNRIERLKSALLEIGERVPQEKDFIHQHVLNIGESKIIDLEKIKVALDVSRAIISSEKFQGGLKGLVFEHLRQTAEDVVNDALLEFNNLPDEENT